MSRHDYLPFGEELGAGVGGRTTAQGYVGDNLRQKFTDKERDAETGLNYFGARYYASTQGRFTTADPLLSSGRPSNPQTWNKYSYTLGNPLKFVDPDGLFEWDASLRDDASLSDKERQRRGKLRDAFTNARAKAAADAAKAHDAGKLSDKKFKEINDALNAYGAVNEKNGVTVGVGTKDGAPGGTDPLFRINDTHDGVTPDIQVKFDEKFLSSKDAAIAVVHEGTHVEDSFAYAAAYPELSKLSGDAFFSDPRLTRQWDTENHAYHVQSYYFEALGKNDDRWGTWQKSWAKLDAQQESVRQIAITGTIEVNYHLTPAEKGWSMWGKTCRPCSR